MNSIQTTKMSTMEKVAWFMDKYPGLVSLVLSIVIFSAIVA
jgi:hypothetical protein